MAEHVEFETPENVRVKYRLAGLGSRFIAWITDQLILGLILVLLFFGFLFVAAATGVGAGWLPGGGRPGRPGNPDTVPLYVFGVFILIAGLGGFLYYTLFEFLMRGQTPGKRSLSIRVVKVDGFSLDFGSILLRNLFRIVDQIPALWLVPFFSQRHQRTGDLVAGTLVVCDAKTELSTLRDFLLRRPAEGRIFHFDATALNKARPLDFEAAEKILERWNSLGFAEREMLLSRVIGPLTERLAVEPPAPELRLEFLKDFLTDEYRRRYRQLG